jgi:uncharacterized protein
LAFGQGFGERLVFIQEQRSKLLQNIVVLLIGSSGGFLLSLTGLSVGWMLGTMMLLGFLSVQRPALFAQVMPQRGLHPIWKQIGQLLLAVQVGQQMTGSVVEIFATAWLPVTVVLVLSLVTSVLLGLFLWRYSGDSLLTSLYAITPGGVSNMPTIAQEVGANAITVSIVQTMRILLVVSIIPFFAMEWRGETGGGSARLGTDAHLPVAAGHSYGWTACLVLAALAGSALGKRCNLPAPRLVGGMIGVALVQFVSSAWNGADLLPWFPSGVRVIAQIFLGASIGTCLQREMFVGMGRTVFVGLVSALCLVLIMLGCSLSMSALYGIPVITSILAFAPGGVAEMAITAVVLQANASFVVAAQTLRLIFIFLILPPLFRLLHDKWVRD